MIRRLRENPVPAILICLGLGLRFVGISHPAVVVWDEAHFERFAQGYLDGKYFFDVHPPLGWLLEGAAMKAAGAPSPSVFVIETGNACPPEYPYVAARVLPALAGGLLPFLIYLVGRALGLSPRACLLAGALVLLENAILAYTRLAMIDIFVHFFTFTAFLAYLRHRASAARSWRWWSLLAAAGVSSGLAFSVKWTGLGALAVMGVTSVTEALERKDWSLPALRAAVLVPVAAAVYVSLMALHFHLLPRSGPGDSHMTPEFRAGLQGTLESKRPEIPPLGFVGRFEELNRKMYSMNVDITMTHPESSRWYQWPFGWRPITFWSDPADRDRRIFLVGNPVVWGFGTLSVLGAVAFAIRRRKRLRELMAGDEEWRRRTGAIEFLLVAYLVYLLPFASISRAMFLYHYFTAYLVAILLGAFLFVDLLPAVGWRDGAPARTGTRRVVGGVIGVAVAAFLIVMPVTYGLRPPLRIVSDLLPHAPPAAAATSP